MTDNFNQNMGFSLRLIYARSVDPAVIYAVENFCEEIQAVVRDEIQEVYWKEESCLQWQLNCNCGIVPIEDIRTALCKYFSIEASRLVIFEDRTSIELSYFPTSKEIAEQGEIFLVLYIPIIQ